MHDAKEILEFNKFMRKRLMEFYRLTKCPVPHSSMLFKRRKAFYIKISSFFLSLLITVQQIGEWFDSQASEYIDYIIHHVTGELMDTELNIQNTVSVPQIQFLIDTIIANFKDSRNVPIRWWRYKETTMFMALR